MMERRRRAAEQSAEPAAVQPDEALSNGQPALEQSAVAGQHSPNGGQDLGQPREQDLQVVGQELVPASQALVLREQSDRGKVGEVKESCTETPKDSMEVQQSSSRSAIHGESGLKELEDMDRSKEFHTPKHPTTVPTSFGPLFTPDQISQWEKVQAEAPLLQGRMEREVPSLPNGLMSGPPVSAGLFPWWSGGMASPQITAEEITWRMQMQRDMEQMNVMLRAAHFENARLRTELQHVKEDQRSSFETPEEQKEEGARAQQELFKEDGARAQQAPKQEDGARAQQVFTKEDGARAQQERCQGIKTEAARGGAADVGSQRAERPKEDGARAQQDQAGPGTSTKPQEMEFMMLMLQSMQELQRKITDDREAKDGVEVVRTGAPDLPQLGEWSSTEGPIMMGDWLTMLEPAIADLSESSEEWWSELIKAVQSWYGDHMKLSPLERTSHRPVPPVQLQQKKWQRLERRVASMLLKAVPESQKEELVAGKSLSAFAIMAHLQILYQPGGLGEKETILRNLEMPPEAATLPEAVVQLRRWSRWRLRARDIGVAEPDASVLLRGLTRLVKKVLEAHADLRFRISLARSTLMLDSAPTAASVERFGVLLLAEIEQIAHTDRQERKTAATKPKINEMKFKKPEELEGEKNGSKGKGKSGAEGKGLPCRYFLTDEGCRKGKDCGFAHNLDQEKRCWSCGSKAHFANSCPRIPEAEKMQGKGIKAMQKTPEKDGKSNSSSSGTPGTDRSMEANDVGSTSGAAGGSTVSQDETMKQLLEEAHKMLKSMSVKSEESGATKGEHRVDILQRQLDDLKKFGLKVFRLTRMERKSSGWGLLDSGATHPLRPPTKYEDLQRMPEVDVTLAGGQEVKMRLSQGGSIVGEPGTEAIVPLGLLTSLLHCRLTWTPGGVRLVHPIKGDIEVSVKEGCPMIESKQALQLIEEIELKNMSKAHLAKLDAQEMGWKKAWVERLAEEHPAFQGLPQRLKEALKEEPSQSLVPLANRRRRKFWAKNGVVIHAFSGEKGGYTLTRALKEVGGDTRGLHEFDVLHGGSHNDMGLSGEAYSHMLNLAFSGHVKGVLGGPPCRTRSVLRHLEVEGVDDLPRPIRAWNGQEFGVYDLKPWEDAQVYEDDVLMFRLWMVWIIAEEVRKMHGEVERPAFGMEQPAEPQDREEVVSIWRTAQWQSFAEAYNFKQQSFMQGDFGGEARKPTTWAGNLSIGCPTPRGAGAKRNVQGLSKDQILDGAKKLARWAPGLMRSIAISIQTKIRKSSITVRKLSWQEHIQAGHVPFRKDCRTCQEACARDAYHRRSKMPPKAGVLSMDITGPFRSAPDLFRGTKARYLLVATFTWPAVKKDQADPLEDEPECPEEAPQIEDEEAEEVEIEEGKPEEGIAQKDHEDLPYMTGVARPELDVEPEPSILGESPEADPEEEEERREEPDIRHYRLLTPLSSRKQKEVMKAIVDMYLRLRSEGFVVCQLHTDNAGEFNSMALADWCTQRAILHTYTTGDQPQSNGRAEQAIGQMKSRIRRMLLAAQVGFERWPLAARCLNEMLWMEATGKDAKCPAFMTEVLVRKRYWRSKEFEPTQERVRYLGPSWTHRGHWVERPDGTKVLTKMVMAGLQQPIDEACWIGLEDDVGPIGLRRRIREKQAVRSMFVHGLGGGSDREGSRQGDREGSNESGGQERPEEFEGQGGQEEAMDERTRLEMAFQRVLEEEMTLAVTEEPAALDVVLGCLAQIRQATVQGEEEDVLQTKVVAVAELRKNIKAWTPAIQAELEALFARKEALEDIDEEEGRRLVLEGLGEVIPAKLVCTVKPDPAIKSGKRKVRIVGCGNYAESDPESELFASGTNAVSVRLALSMAAQKAWHGLSMDIRTAFLNAPMDGRGAQEGSEVDETPRKRAFMKPPSILVSLGFVKPNVWWEAKKAVYGYRQSPRLWSDYRDEVMAKIKVSDGPKSIRFSQMLSEPSIWKIIEEDEDQGEEEVLRGLLLIYVDDLLVLGELSTIHLAAEAIKGIWEVSAPEQINDQKGTRFLGMELWRKEEGTWMATQIGYTTDLLRRNLGEDQASWPKRKLPASKDIDEVPEEEKGPQDVKAAQKAVGELIWLVTRCRPDLMYSVARLASGITKMPKMVVKLAHQVWMYLAGSVDHGLVFKNDAAENSLNVFSDASFGDLCQGCVLVQWGQSALLWKSSRETLRSSSTAEAELIEFLEAINSGEAVRVVIEEILGHSCHALAHTDSTAALAIAVGESGSWKTRHLRRRAHSLRWRISRGDWLARHLPGNDMPADIGTKALCREKFERFKIIMGMGKIEEDEERQQVRVPAGNGEDVKLKKILVSVILAAKIALSKAEDPAEDPGENPGEATLLDIFVFYFVLPATLFLAAILWYQKRAAQTKLKEKEEKEAVEESERKIKEEVKRQVSQGIKRLQREGSQLLDEDSEGEISSIRMTPAPAMHRARSDDESVSGTSGIARSSGARGSASSQRGERSELRARDSVGHMPSLSFPPDAEDLFVSPGGAKYHFSRECRGLRKASPTLLLLEKNLASLNHVFFAQGLELI
eukprot:s827_g10.t1